MKRFLAVSALSALLLGTASAANATVNWNWSFTQDTINLAQSTSVYVTVNNLATSDESIALLHLDYGSFGDFGVLTDSSTGVQIVPASMSHWDLIAPGQSVTYEEMSFFFASNASGLSRPSADFVQTILPSMTMGGSSCESPWLCGISRPAEAALTLVYAPVPEVAPWSLWIGGLAGLAAFVRCRRDVG